MRRRSLLPLVSLIVFTDTLLFAAIVPLVPVYADTYDLDKLGAGLIVGAYAAGAMVAGIPSGYLAGHIGPKRTVAVGLVSLAAASVVFAVAGSAAVVGLARFAQGLSSAVTWSGALAWLTLSTPRERRGQTLGTAFAFAVLGFIVGPVVGAIAHLVSVRAVFLGVAAATLALAAVAATYPAGRRETREAGGLGRALRDGGFLTAVWVTMVPALFFGAIDLLVPLSFDAAGWGSIAIAVTFACAGLIEFAIAPLSGRLSDRRGRLYPVRISLWALAAGALGLSVVSTAFLIAALVLAVAAAASGISTPGIALVSDKAEANGVPQSLGFGVMNAAWAFGAMVGPIAAGAIAGSLGDAAPYLACAVIAVLTVVGVARVREEPHTA